MRHKIFMTCLWMLWATSAPLQLAAEPQPAVYSTENDNIFWFVLMSDIHIGAEGTDDSENLRWMLTEAADVIQPSFILSAGDLTDSTDWNQSGYPDGPHLSEWLAYREILDDSGVTPDFYYDLPGNHDHFGDRTFEYYRNYSMQGAATGQTQVSWTRNFDFGKYHFLGINTCGNDGVDFSMLPPTYGDNAGLDTLELTFIEEELEANQDANLTMVFGHHLIYKREVDWSDPSVAELEEPLMTALTYGADPFVDLLDRYGVVLYGYGHTHTAVEEFLVKDMAGNGVLYLNTASLTKSPSDNYNIVAVDNNGISTITMDVGAWPAVIITAPLDRHLGMRNNPYTSGIEDRTGNSTPIRALVFDRAPVTKVEYAMYRVLEKSGQFVEGAVSGVVEQLEDEGIWKPMARVGEDHPLYPSLWEADCPNPLGGGDYTVVVRATGSSTRADRVPTAFPAEPVNKSGCFIRTVSLNP